MSKREFEDDGYRGSSRSSLKSRDDRRKLEGSLEKERHGRRDRSRSREGRRRSRSRDDRSEDRRRSDKADTKVREMSISPQREGKDIEDSSPSSAPPPPRISKISIGFKNTAAKAQPIKMSLNSSSTQSNPVVKKPPLVASVFNDGSDEEPEEMPPEARMRMRNIGRETPTSVGPNSFGKTKHGFCDQKAITQKNLKAAMEQANPSAPSGLKYPGVPSRLGH